MLITLMINDHIARPDWPQLASAAVVTQLASWVDLGRAIWSLWKVNWTQKVASLLTEMRWCGDACRKDTVQSYNPRISYKSDKSDTVCNNCRLLTLSHDKPIRNTGPKNLHR